MEQCGEKQHNCLVCKSQLAREQNPVLDLGIQPLANQLLPNNSESYTVAPLGFSSCNECGHGQLSHFVQPEVLFKTYLYQSGTSTTLRNFFKWFAKNLWDSASAVERPAHTQAPSVLEIACNDGSLLDSLRDQGFSVEGIDPAHNIVSLARDKGHTVFEDFFPSAQITGRYEYIVAMNVLAHTPHPGAVMDGIAAALAKDGAALIQTSQAYMLENFEFDTVYHEHYSFFTVASLSKLAEASGLRLERVELVSVHGTSFVFILRHQDYNGPALEFPVDKTFSVAKSDEDIPAFRDVVDNELRAQYSSFADFATETLTRSKALIEEYRSKGFRIALLGVAAKSLTFLNAGGITPDYYFDEAPLKIGTYIPQRGVIQSLDEVALLQEPTLFIIGAWNFAEELSRKVQQKMSEPTSVASKGAIPYEFLVYFPTLQAFSL